ncbi:MAG: DUF2206 domain-containing protein [Nitrososphaeria archaeon]
MKILSFFQMNDWEIGELLKVIILFQVLVIALTLLDYVGLQIPFVRQIVCFIYLTFIPGMLVLRALKIHNLDPIENLCYSVGLSLAVIMFSGLFANMVYPLLGMPKPISTIPLMITLTLLVSVLCLIDYIRDRNFVNKKVLEIKLSPPSLFLCLIPFLGIIGTYFVNYYSNNILLIFLLFLVGLIPILAACNIIEERLYPLTTFIASTSLLYHTSLISKHVWGWDIQLEYYFSKLTLANGWWDPSIYGAINGMPAIVLLAPSYATLCSIDLVWVFKIIYPVLFSFVPMAMYSLFERMISKKASVLACFLFMFTAPFYFTMLQLARQQIAELFLVLMLLAVATEGLKEIYKSLFLIIFGVSLVMSHYGTAYLFMFILIAYFAISRITRSQMFSSRFYGQNMLRDLNRSTLRSPFIAMYAASTLAWYMYVAGSHPFETFVHSVQIIFEEFVNPFQSDAFQLLIRGTVSPLHDVTKILYHITQFLTAIGILDLLFMRRKTEKIKGEYSLLSIIFFSIWVASAIFPYYGFDFTRVYHITLIVLSPFCIVGGLALTEFSGVLLRKKLNITSSQALKIISVFLCVFLLFNSGWVYELTKDNPASIALSNIDSPVFNEQEVAGARWLHASKGEGKIYADDYRWLLLIGFEGYPYTWYSYYKSQSSIILYVFMGDFNIRSGTVLETYKVGPCISVRDYVEISTVLEGLSKIYDSGNAQIFLKTSNGGIKMIALEFNLSPRTE